MEVLTVAIQKGGTGKTTTAAALAQAAVYRGRSVLAIDLDPQGQLGFTLAADTSKPGSYDLLNGTPAAELIQHIRDGLDVIPASWNLSTITSGRGSARRLQRAIEPIKNNYDLIIIDTPPTAGELQYNALQAATRLIIPLQADIYNLQSLYQITDTARQIQDSNPNLSITGFVLTQYDGRSTILRQMKEAITERAEAMGVPYLGAIRAAVAVKEAAALQQSLFDYAPKSKPAADYLKLHAHITGDSAFYCLLTHEVCMATDAGIYDSGDSCPILKYKNSNRETDTGEILDDTCRYYGIARAKELQKIFKEDL